jgi:phosphoribosylanthranilate isomerase
MAIDAGADAFGMIFAPSPRRIEMEAAAEIARRVPGFIEPVGVFVNPSPQAVDRVRALFPHARLQFCGDETAELVASHGDRAIKAIHVDEQSAASALQQRCDRFPRATILFDSRCNGMAGGTGTPFNWSRVASIAATRRVVIAGGLSPENVADCVRKLRPFGVDVRNGIESEGRKSAAKMRAFVRAVREADEA